MSLKTIVPIKAQTDRLEQYLKSIAHGAEFQLEYLNKINRLIGGFERKKLVVVGSRPSEGKSAFSLQMAYELSAKYRVLYLSLEMTVEEAMFRVFCYETKIPNSDFHSGRIYDYKIVFDKFKRAIAEKERFLVVGEEIGRTWGEIDNVFEKLKDDTPDIIMLDYIQCIRSNGKKMDAIEDYIKKFRALAIEKKFCLFICSQINRANLADNKTKEPTMEGLKNTGFLEEHADKVILLHYPCKHKEGVDINQYKVIVAKNKNGMTGYVNCKITPEIYRIWEDENG